MKGLICFALLITGHLAAAKKAPAFGPDWKFAEAELRKAGFERSFIRALKKNYDSEPFAEVLELNTLLFLKRSDYHGVQVNEEAADKVRAFVAENSKTFRAAEKKFGVSSEVIASLLWIESRHGNNRGQFHVPSVFVDLLQTNRPQTLAHLYKASKRFTPTLSKENKRGITKRAKKRVKWAIAELKAVEKMYKRNKNALKDFKGSFAGAFGMAQFEPSSYVHYAHAADKKRIPDLERKDDAIFSVANYLKKSGWKSSKSKTHIKALMRYNNSRDYADAILNLARQAMPEDASKRAPAHKKGSRP